MEFGLTLFSSAELEKRNQNAILECNLKTTEYGITLSQNDAKEIIEARAQALSETERIEFGTGAAEEIINSFCDSPYVSQDNFAETVRELIEAFYTFKNETLDLLSDKKLISLMRKYFDEASGSVDVLSSTYLENIARNVRFGYPPEYTEYEGEAQNAESEY